MRAASAALSWIYGISFAGWKVVPGVGYCWLMKERVSPTDMMVSEIKRAFNAELYFIALSATLSLPDICSALEKPAGHQRYRKIQTRYEDWCRRYLIPHYKKLTPEDVWILRGGVVHNAMLVKGRDGSRYIRVIFGLPGGNRMNEVTFTDINEHEGTALVLDLSTFCHNMFKAVDDWFAEKKDDPIVAAGLPDVVR
jgi:hypothetical protein